MLRGLPAGTADSAEQAPPRPSAVAVLRPCPILSAPFQSDRHRPRTSAASFFRSKSSCSATRWTASTPSRVNRVLTSSSPARASSQASWATYSQHSRAVRRALTLFRTSRLAVVRDGSPSVPRVAVAVAVAVAAAFAAPTRSLHLVESFGLAGRHCVPSKSPAGNAYTHTCMLSRYTDTYRYIHMYVQIYMECRVHVCPSKSPAESPAYLCSRRAVGRRGDVVGSDASHRRGSHHVCAAS
jgi:hypothetical protein